MERSLVVAVAQPLTRTDDLEGNAVRHADLVRVADARVVVFPELSLTGYEFGADLVDVDDARLSPLVEACDRAGAVALAGAPVASPGGGEKASIAVLAVDGGGVSVAYRKLYLGGREAERFEPGREPRVLTVDGWRLGLAVCRDTGVAAHARRTVALGIDGYVAGMLEFAEDVEVPAERARRIGAEHGVWVAMASFAGSTGEGYDRAAGRSGVWLADGREAARAGSEVGAVARAVVGRRDPSR